MTKCTSFFFDKDENIPVTRYKLVCFHMLNNCSYYEIEVDLFHLPQQWNRLEVEETSCLVKVSVFFLLLNELLAPFPSNASVPFEDITTWSKCPEFFETNWTIAPLRRSSFANKFKWIFTCKNPFQSYSSIRSTRNSTIQFMRYRNHCIFSNDISQ